VFIDISLNRSEFRLFRFVVSGNDILQAIHGTTISQVGHKKQISFLVYDFVKFLTKSLKN
jgi:hypothetical protein